MRKIPLRGLEVGERSLEKFGKIRGLWAFEILMSTASFKYCAVSY